MVKALKMTVKKKRSMRDAGQDSKRNIILQYSHAQHRHRCNLRTCQNLTQNLYKFQESALRKILTKRSKRQVRADDHFL